MTDGFSSIYFCQEVNWDSWWKFWFLLLSLLWGHCRTDMDTIFSRERLECHILLKGYSSSLTALSVLLCATWQPLKTSYTVVWFHMKIASWNVLRNLPLNYFFLFQKRGIVKVVLLAELITESTEYICASLNLYIHNISLCHSLDNLYCYRVFFSIQSSTYI